MEPRTIAAWVTHPQNGEVVWERLSNDTVKVNIYNENKVWVCGFGVSNQDWEDIVRVFTLKGPKVKRW